MTVRLAQQSDRSASYDHNYALASALYEALRAFHPEVGREIHQSRDRAKIAVGEIYHLPDRRGEAYFRMSSPDEHLLRLYGGALVATGKLQVGGSVYSIRGTETHALPAPIPPVGVHTLSPILIRDRDSPRSLVMDNCDYPTVLAGVVNHDIERATGKTATVRVLNMAKLEVRKRSLSGRTVLAQKGTFWLHGEPEELRHVLDWGIGHSTGLGFGCVVVE